MFLSSRLCVTIVVMCRFLLHVTGLVALEVEYRSFVAHVDVNKDLGARVLLEAVAFL